MKQVWLYLVNPFLNATKESFIKFLIISTYHLNRLKVKAGDAFYDAIIALYEPQHNAFVDAYNIWKAAGGIEQGGTAEMDELIGQLSHDKAEEWDIMLQNVYRRKTSTYTGLLPHHRKLFQHGSTLERITAIKTFSDALAKDNNVALDDLKTDVLTFYTTIHNLFGVNSAKQGNVKLDSQKVDAARVKAGIEMFRDLSKLNVKFAEDPEQSGAFFDQETLRNAAQVHFTHGIHAQQLYTIVRRTLLAMQSIIIHNTGNVPLFFFAASQKKQHDADTMFEVQPGETKTFTPAQFGNAKATPYFNVLNKADFDGHFDMDLKN